MRKPLLVVVLFFAYQMVVAQCAGNIDFNTWSQAGQPGNGNWSVQGGGTQVYQSINGAPTFYISPFDMMNVRISGSFRSTDFDDDWMGFVFSFLNPMGAIDSFDCWLFDWKQEFQGSSPRGMSLCRADGVIPPAAYGTTFNAHQNTAAFTVVQDDFGGPGWNWNTDHEFEIYLTYTRVRIFIDGSLVFDHTDCFKPGRFGFYNLSQSDCIYSDFNYGLYVDFSPPNGGRLCRGQAGAFNFVNACVNTLGQYQSLTWDFGDGNTIVNNNPTLANVNVTHTYAAAGVYNAVLTVVDNNGCVASATRQIDVRNPIVLTPTLNQPPCNGGFDGSISVSATGGFGGYGYSWNGGANIGPVYNGIPAGTYTITASDGACVTTANFTLNQPTPLTATTSHTDASCGVNNGTVSITVSGGTPPYQGVSWAGVPGATRTGLAPGMYIADFRDANNCSSLLQYRETVGSLPCGLTSSVTKTNVTCFGGNNGTATVTVTGSTPPVNITWSNGATGASVSGLVAGPYTFTFTDANPAHTFTGSVTITQPGAAMVAQVTTTPISCAGVNNGQAIASVTSGGNAPYTYLWSGGHPNNPVVSNLPPGGISVTITDNSGCSATASGTISGVPSLTATVTTTIDSCYRSGRGRAIASVSGGSPPYDFEWSNFDTDSAALNLIEGTYTVTITDNNGCTITRSATITGPTALTQSFTVQNIDCAGDSTGSFNISASGGTPPYAYTWNPATLSGSNPTGLAAGLYNFTITDGYGCRIFGGDTLTEPDSVLVATSSHTNVSCPGGNDGTLTITVGGGTPPYTFQGLPVPAGTTTIPGRTAGVYAGNLVDANGCTVALSETITEPGPQSLTLVVTDVTCNGATDGTATADFVNATGLVTYDWNPGGVLPAARTGLAPGTYAVTATDANGCTVSGSDSIAEPAPLPLSLTVVDAACFGGNGSVTANHSGVAPFAYDWGNGPGTLQTITPPVGSYSVTATDANQCNETASFVINQPPQILLQEQHTNPVCFGDNTGTIDLTIIGGTAPYTFNWSPNVSSDSSATGLVAGVYLVTVTDQGNCSSDTSITITQPDVLAADSIVVRNISCFGLTDGSITLYVSGGTGTYSYAWSPNVSSTNVASNLSANSYSVTVSDVNSCSFSATETIIEPAQITFTQTQTDLTCYQDSTGVASVNVSGGTLPFSYLWSPNVSSTNTATNLAAGSYSVTMTDAGTCSASTSFVLTEPSQLVVTETHTNNSCATDNNAYIILSASGGTGTYTYQWNPNVSSNDSALSLVAGAYSFSVTDSSSCVFSQTVTITAPPLLVLTATATNVLCFGESSGTLTAVATGGTTPYSYTITPDGVNFQNSQTGLFTGLAAGTYSVVVADANACTDSLVIQITQPPVLTATTASTDVSCYGLADGSIVVSGTGGTPAYTYALSSTNQNNNGVFTGLVAGNYSVTVTDANNCTLTDVAVINEPPPVEISVNPVTAEVNLGDIIELEATSNQQGAVVFNWSPNFGLSCYDCPNPVFSGNYSMVYTVTAVTDQGCSGSNMVNITVIPAYDIFIPNVFTPNDDGVNDVWSIFGVKGVKQLHVMVFNRWGEKVFESNEINFGWEGDYKGEPAPNGVYTYVAKFVWLDNHSDSDYKGSITLLR